MKIQPLSCNNLYFTSFPMQKFLHLLSFFLRINCTISDITDSVAYFTHFVKHFYIFLPFRFFNKQLPSLSFIHNIFIIFNFFQLFIFPVFRHFLLSNFISHSSAFIKLHRFSLFSDIFQLYVHFDYRRFFPAFTCLG